MTEQEVQQVWANVWSMLKGNVKDGEVSSGKDGFPEFWPGYNASRKARQEILIHVQPGAFPEDLFRSKAPNQTDAEMGWMRANFRQVTLPVYMDLENTVGRAMHQSNWSLDFEQDAQSQAVEDYIKSGIREWGSLTNFIRFALTRIKVPDPMGLLVFAPSAVDVIEQEDGTLLQDTDAPVEPDIHYFPCNDLLGFQYDRWYLVKRPEKTEVTYGNTTKRAGMLLWLIDDEYVWQIEQYGRQADYTFRISTWYRHGLGYPPAINMLGTPRPVGSRLLWESPYIAVKDVLDTALLGEHWLRAVEAKCVFPTTVIIGSPCMFTDAASGACCNGIGTLEWAEGDIMRKTKCPGCNGTGMTPRLSPLGQIVINPDTQTSTGDGVNASNAFTIVSPPVDVPTYLKQQFFDRLKYARSVMHLDAETPMAGGDVKTATQAGLNARAKDAFVKPIADQSFFIFEFAIRAIGQQIAGPEWNGFTLRAPDRYDLRTDSDHIAEIATAMEKGLPPSIVDYMVWEYITARYESDPAALAAFEVITKSDRLQGMAPMMIQAEAAAGRVKPWEIYLHYSGMMIYEQLVREPGFEALDIGARVERMKQVAQEMATSPAATDANNPLMRLAQRVAA
jgi:hypothetical protein